MNFLLSPERFLQVAPGEASSHSRQNARLSLQSSELAPPPPHPLTSLPLFYPSDQWWANLDQTPNDLDKTIFRDLSPTPLP